MIRAYSSEDTEILTALWLRASLQVHDFIDAGYWYQQADNIRNLYLPAAETWVWEENGEVLAFVSLLDKEYIGALFVDPVFQGKGIGRKLLCFLQKKFSLLRLSVFLRNEKAVRFYVRNGFVAEARQIDGATGESEIRMCWKRK